MDVYRDTERLMAAKKTPGGPPDLKKPFVRGGRSAAKKQPEPEPEEFQDDQTNEDGVEIQEFSEDNGEYLPDVDDTMSPPPQQQPQPQQYPPPQPPYYQPQPPYYQPPPQPSPQPVPQEPPDPFDVQIYHFNANNQALGIHVQNIQKLLEIQKKYLTYQKALIETFEKAMLKSKREREASVAQTAVYTPVAIGSKPGLSAQPLSNGAPEDGRKARMKTAVFMGIGVMLIGGSIYLGTEGKLPMFNIIAYVLAGIGGGLLTKIVK